MCLKNACPKVMPTTRTQVPVIVYVVQKKRPTALRSKLRFLTKCHLVFDFFDKMAAVFSSNQQKWLKKRYGTALDE